MTGLDRVNTRMAFLSIQRQLDEILNGYIGDFNDIQTRETLKSEMEEYTTHLRDRDGISDFQIICDKSNNTTDDIDNGMLNVSVMIQPIQSIEFVTFVMSLGRYLEPKIEFLCDADAYRHRLGI